jgi:hypothetical protein
MVVAGSRHGVKSPGWGGMKFFAPIVRVALGARRVRVACGCPDSVRVTCGWWIGV